MATPVMMPKVGISVETCILTKWHKQKGDAVKAGDVLFTYETDKSTLDEAAPVDGVLLATFFEEDDVVPVMVNVAVIGNEGENIAEFAPAGEADEAPAAPAAEAAPAAAEAAPAAAAAPAAEAKPREGFIAVSPRARVLAEKLGVDVRLATPTGAEGRVCENDIRNLAANGPVATKAAAGAFAGEAGTGIGGKFSTADIGKAAPAAAAVAEAAVAAPAYVDEKMPGIRKVIAKTMTTSLTTIPQLTHTTTFDATEIMGYRKKLKANAEALGLPNITVTDLIIYAVSRVLAKEEHRALNANLIDGETMRYFTDVNIGLAVDTPRGLMVPTIFGANKMSLVEISEAAKDLANACKKGDISPDKLSGASFTISNVGAFGIESFTPVINPPQTGILGVNSVMTRVKEKDGQISTYQAMGLSLTYDHRALDGVPASKFLVDLKAMLENITILLAK